MLEFIQFSLLRFLKYFWSFRFLKSYAPFFRVGGSIYLFSGAWFNIKKNFETIKD